ncbi:tetratricopeptide repeat protein [Hypnocyclicus thermotrophus]|uniref:Tetratricopeptide repeat protein n=1 Tax=Hypnocyclicus thermotrophus TaxID=1627895 RepID=A0AA46I609_9FUSO|nr:tetratricopeptide repeat protein [Hypnocyclicus thermotrophus]TDT71506.1 tetratricopeptide repeat protein [Hypnocyclicus thermotrophus]
MKIGRNDPCPCGSGKKYKKCCINKLSEQNVEELYLKQLELTRGLKNEKNCHTILEIGKRIVSKNSRHACITGTYVNMALAKRVLYCLNHNLSDLKDAKIYCNKALELKDTNQAALKNMYGICLELKEYQDACLYLSKYKDTNIFSPMSIQIIEEYQNAIEYANRDNYSQTIKEGLDKITDTLFNKFGMNAGLCGVAIMYYLGIGNDTIRAYELGKRCIEEWPNSSTYNSLGWICLNSEIKRKEDAISYFLKAIELSNDDKQKTQIRGNYFVALMENKHFEKAEKLILDLIKINPCNQNFSNYAELLKRQGRFEEALGWGNKALFLIEDDTTLLVVADIYKRMKKYKDAVEMYQLCLGHINAGENVYKFNDTNKYKMYSIASNNSLDLILYEILKGLISSFNLLRDYENAKAYLEIAKEKLPQKSDWEIWDQTLPEIEVTLEKHKEIKMKLTEIEKCISAQKNFIRNWAFKLMQLQNNSEQLNLNEDDDWTEYEKEMENILNEMSKIINKESIVYRNAETFVNSTFAHLNNVAKEFLITAETLYEIHKFSIIDFAPIVVEYCKVVEKQLRVLLGSRVPSDAKTLGGVLYTIRNNRISPYNQYLGDLYSVNKLRKSGAHTGNLRKNDVDKIRNIFYTNNLLNRLI